MRGFQGGVASSGVVQGIGRSRRWPACDGHTPSAYWQRWKKTSVPLVGWADSLLGQVSR